MTYVVTQACCNDATCVAVCPVNCIHPTPDEAQYARTEMLYIDPDTCIDCGACADVCPVEAIVPESDLTPETEIYKDLNAAYFLGNPTVSGPTEVPREPVVVAERPGPLRVAIVGSGPSAFYAAEELLKRRDVDVEVSMFERLPVVGGLVRFGVAPDHQTTKAVERGFSRTAGRSGFRAFLGVEIGRDLGVGELLDHHHAVIHAGGASDDRKLGIPGEDLPGSSAAREFVGWYNGHPDYADRTFDLSGRRAVVIGNGNVALDVARILARDPERLVPGDIAEHALDVLRRSAIEEVVVLGRRGPEHGAFTTPELLALGLLPEVDVTVQDGYDAPEGASIKLRTIAEYAQRRPQPGRRTITLRFHAAPIEVLGGTRVEGLRIAPYGVAGPGEDLEASLVLRSVGYRGRPVPGLPFDAARGTIPNIAGRVVDPADNRPISGLYVAGWIKRGPTGVIGTNRYCAAETVEAIVADHERALLPRPSRTGDDLASIVEARCPGVFGFDGWRRIDRYERTEGRRRGRARQKLVEVEAMLAVAHGADARSYLPG
ncbi:4Fe-4S binding protein [Rhodococcus rhodochrous]|uniref:ferredoxin--NADP(+) reductase n=1 Tax=Rhodococcus rhodochrous KG-21 TaxID=1441923 RepID=A0A0M9WQ38_RHORH|nr:4Fe-4S binding protein [Rhodococcus rhodochrous]KOS57321.1 ferredoxin [Rhodococcus rhodochrous KG-21]